jgi:hypothetical protein
MTPHWNNQLEFWHCTQRCHTCQWLGGRLGGLAGDLTKNAIFDECKEK